MRLVIPAVGPSATDAVDARFGRARYFIVYDTDTDACRTLDNTDQADALQGAGVQASQAVVASGADALLAGRCGPKAFAVLAAAGVRIYSGVDGTVQDAITAWRNDELELLDAPDGTPRH